MAELTARQIELLAEIKKHGPGTPEARAAFAAYEAEGERAKAESDLERRVANLELENAALKRQLDALSKAQRKEIK